MSQRLERCSDLAQVKAHIQANALCLLFIKMPNCGVCDAVFAKTEELLLRFPQVRAIYAAMEEVPDVSGEFLVFTAPTIILFLDGKEVSRQARFVQLGKLEETLTLLNESD